MSKLSDVEKFIKVLNRYMKHPNESRIFGKKQIRKGIKVQPLSKYATNDERRDYNARLRNLGRKKANSTMKKMPYFV